ncbi:hypothetical protein FPOA_00079 [Fusarium poae]|uniref:Serine-threonine/tyrosine-protein kinase catalytic domain-containing protein n=1 Tax=Fusarium poae TaxID=36050 RepID=A0A1B8B0C4_FUSPO|nr:hypothetical protein FPOA_00079 [Fusarium poae]
MENEMVIYDALQVHPHCNFAQRLEPCTVDYLFLERLDPLEKIWPLATRDDRVQWALGLLDAMSWLEKLGFVHGDLAVRNLGVDKRNTLKVFDFGSSFLYESANDLIADHFDLSTFLHFILSGVDPFAGVQSHADVIDLRKKLKAGRWTIAEGAEVIGDIIEGGWTGSTGTQSFTDTFKQVATILGTPNLSLDSDSMTTDYPSLGLRCQDWLRKNQRNPAWKKIDEYIAKCRNAGHDRDLDHFR